MSRHVAFEIVPRKRGRLRRKQCQVNLVGANGEVLMSSEGYNNKADAQHMVDVVVRSLGSQFPPTVIVHKEA